MKRMLSALVAAVAAVSLLSGCSGNAGDTLPPVVTHGIPDEKVKSTIVADGFTVDIHSTYAEIKSYAGKDVSVTVPESAAGVTVKLIGEGAFRNNAKIVKVTLPSGLISIDRYAFEGCTALSSVDFNDGLESVNDYAFRNSGLTVLNLPDSVSTVGKYSFYGTKISSVKIPASVSRAGKYAFYGCTDLKTIEFCPRMTEIAERMFFNCTALEYVLIPETVTKIGEYAFSSCTSLEKIVIPATVTKVGEGAFVGCDRLTIYAPAGSEAEKNAGNNNYRFSACDYRAEAEKNS